MANYKYEAMRPNGEKFSGEINLPTEREVRNYLKEKGYFIKTIKEKKDRSNLEINVFKKVTTKDLSVFCRKLHAMLEAGLPIVSAIEILGEQTNHRTLKRAIQVIYEDLQKGLTFSEALKEHRDVFPNLMIFMIESGETSGSIDTILDRLAIDYEKDAKIRNQIKAAMVYPILLGGAAVCLVVFMLVFILPTFQVMFDNSPTELPQMTQFVINAGESLKQFWYFYIGAIIALIVVGKVAASTHMIKRNLDYIKINAPIIKKYNTLVITTRFTRTLATMLFSGVPLLNCLDNLSRAVGNKIVEEKIIVVSNDVRRGSDLATPIRKMEFFPRMVDSMINIGEESGSLDDILVKTTTYFDDELETTIKQLTSLFEPLMIVIMGVVIGFIVIAMVLPMFEMANTV